MTKALRETIIETIAKELEIDTDAVSETSSLDGLGADSPKLLEVAVALEDEFGIDVPDEDLAKFRTVGDIITYVQKKISTGLSLVHPTLRLQWPGWTTGLPG